MKWEKTNAPWGKNLLVPFKETFCLQPSQVESAKRFLAQNEGIKEYKGTNGELDKDLKTMASLAINNFFEDIEKDFPPKE